MTNKVSLLIDLGANAATTTAEAASQAKTHKH